MTPTPFPAVASGDADAGPANRVITATAISVAMAANATNIRLAAGRPSGSVVRLAKGIVTAAQSSSRR